MKRLPILLMLVLAVPLYAEKVRVTMTFKAGPVDTLFEKWTQEIPHKEYTQRPDTAILGSKITPSVPDTLVRMVLDSVMWIEYIPRVDTLTAQWLAEMNPLVGWGRTSNDAGLQLSFTADSDSRELLDTLRLKQIAEAFKGCEFKVQKIPNFGAIRARRGRP